MSGGTYYMKHFGDILIHQVEYMWTLKYSSSAAIIEEYKTHIVYELYYSNVHAYPIV